MKYILLFSLSLCILTACGWNDNYAPVTTARQPNQKNDVVHVVRHGETLYALAWYYDQDYQYLAKINHLSEPYTIYSGQKIRLVAGKSPISTPKKKKTAIPGRKTAKKSNE